MTDPRLTLRDKLPLYGLVAGSLIAVASPFLVATLVAWVMRIPLRLRLPVGLLVAGALFALWVLCCGIFSRIVRLVVPRIGPRAAEVLGDGAASVAAIFGFWLVFPSFIAAALVCGLSIAIFFALAPVIEGQYEKERTAGGS